MPGPPVRDAKEVIIKATIKSNGINQLLAPDHQTKDK
jgi:hypothetical protein